MGTGILMNAAESHHSLTVMKKINKHNTKYKIQNTSYRKNTTHDEHRKRKRSARGWHVRGREKQQSRECFKFFKTLSFEDEKNSFIENEIIAYVIVCIATV